MPFPLYRRPGGVVFLDDDRDYLELLAEVMPGDWHVRLFVRPAACVAQLLHELPKWETDAWQQQEIVRRWREGAPLIPQILKYWRDDGAARFAFTQVCVVDYSMPAMSGLRVLGELADWSGSRVLLTGRADEQLAVSAFNAGLIEQFVAKQSPDIRLRLTSAIQTLIRQPDPRHQQIWRATLTREQHALLGQPPVSDWLENQALKQGWVEHVVIGAPFGVLALDRKGEVLWLQLEPSASLQELAEMARCEGWDTGTVEDIAAGNKLIDLELQLALGSDLKAEPRQAFSVGSGSEHLRAAIFSVSSPLKPDLMASHERFIAALGERQLQD